MKFKDLFAKVNPEDEVYLFVLYEGDAGSMFSPEPYTILQEIKLENTSYIRLVDGKILIGYPGDLNKYKSEEQLAEDKRFSDNFIQMTRE